MGDAMNPDRRKRVSAARDVDREFIDALREGLGMRALYRDDEACESGRVLGPPLPVHYERPFATATARKGE